MRPIYLHNLTAFLCITGSLIVIGDSSPLATPPQRAALSVRPQQIRRPLAQQSSSTPFWSGQPTDELEAKMHFYMQPTVASFFTSP